MLAGGGVVTAIIVYAVMRLTGVDISGLVGGNTASSSTSSPSEPYKGTPEEEELFDFVEFALDDMQGTFRALFDRLPDLEVTGEPDRLRSSFVNGVKRLPARLGEVR